jgi:hypothetical protein
MATHHEASDANIAGVFGFGAGLLIAGAIILFCVWLLFQFFAGREGLTGPAEYPLSTGQQERVPPEPRLQTNPRQDLSDLRAREDAVLGTYGWVDKNAGIVRIPIDDAMKLTVERGLPARREGGKK